MSLLMNNLLLPQFESIPSKRNQCFKNNFDTNDINERNISTKRHDNFKLQLRKIKLGNFIDEKRYKNYDNIQKNKDSSDNEINNVQNNNDLITDNLAISQCQNPINGSPQILSTDPKINL